MFSYQNKMKYTNNKKMWETYVEVKQHMPK